MSYVLKTNFHNNPNLGLYGFATDSYCILPLNLSKKILDEIKNILKVPIYQTTINNTNLIGVYCTGNDNTLLLPGLTKTSELENLKGLNYKIIETRLTALGNNMLIKDNICLINPNFSTETKKQLQKLNFKVFTGTIAKTNIVGSCAVLNKKGILLHPDSTHSEIKKIEEIFKTPIDIGTVNMGNPYVKSGIIANTNGYIVGQETSGYEIMHIDDILRYLK